MTTPLWLGIAGPSVALLVGSASVVLAKRSADRADGAEANIEARNSAVFSPKVITPAEAGFDGNSDFPLFALVNVGAGMAHNVDLEVDFDPCQCFWGRGNDWSLVLPGQSVVVTFGPLAEVARMGLSGHRGTPKMATLKWTSQSGVAQTKRFELPVL